MKKAWKQFVTQFKPKYSVKVITYHVIPGLPVTKNAETHSFGKGEREAATRFYEQAVGKTKEIKLAPAEIHLVKGRRKVLAKQHFGPVEDLKVFKISA